MPATGPSLYCHTKFINQAFAIAVEFTYLCGMNIHFISIGGAVMHNMAIALHKEGFRVTGSDDEIFEPSRSRLARHGLLPAKEGWDADRITKALDGIIVGMHARKDNPELQRARELGIRTWSFPEYIYERSRHKTRVVIGGSHGKTTITAMVMHVMRYHGMDFDYMVGSQLEGFDTMVRLTEKAPVVILEGDEYLSSPLDPRPKFHLYRPHIALLTGIAWDHMNVFPTFEVYLEQFREFMQRIEPNGVLFWFDGDEHLAAMTEELTVENHSYTAHPYLPETDNTFLDTGSDPVSVPFFGKHNMQNISGALHICRELGLTGEQFYEAIASFEGAARRQQLLAEGDGKRVYLDFAHAPSKVRATVEGFRERYPGHHIVACLELHTFSSLNKNFLPQYARSMDAADEAVVYYNPEVVRHKNLPMINEQEIRQGFDRADLEVISNRDTLLKRWRKGYDRNTVLLWMTSGSFSGIDLAAEAWRITGQ